MNTQNKKQFEPVKLTLSKEVVMVLNNEFPKNNNNCSDDTKTGQSELAVCGSDTYIFKSFIKC